MMPASLMFMTNAVAASATAYTPKSAGDNNLASTNPIANVHILMPRLPSRLHVSPRPALRPIPSTCSVLESFAARCASSDTLKPDLPPERNELARTAGVIDACADNILQHDAGILHRQHRAGLLVQ